MRWLLPFYSLSLEEHELPGLRRAPGLLMGKHARLQDSRGTPLPTTTAIPSLMPWYLETPQIFKITLQLDVMTHFAILLWL